MQQLLDSPSMPSQIMAEMARLTVPASGPDQVIRGQIWGWNPGKDMLL